MTRVTARQVTKSLLIISAAVLLGVLLLVTFFMLIPRNWDGIGSLGALALMFPTQLLAISAVSILLGLICHTLRISLGTVLFVAATALSFLMAAIPLIATLNHAGQHSLHVSLSTSVKLDTNDRQDQQDRTETYVKLADGSELQLDIWAPSSQDSAGPAIIKVHGGAWTHGARHEMTAWDQWLREQGYTVFNISYRLSPPARWQEAVGDVKAALSWVALHAESLNVDPDRLCMMGYSAGGHLSMMAAFTPEHPSFPTTYYPTAIQPACVINLYGISDLGRLYEDSGSLPYIRSAMRDYMGGTPKDYPERYQLISPLNHVDGGSPPTLTILGQQDRIVPEEQALLLDEAFQRAGAHHELWLIPAVDHGFDFNWNGLATQAARQRVLRFLKTWAR